MEKEGLLDARLGSPDSLVLLLASVLAAILTEADPLATSPFETTLSLSRCVGLITLHPALQSSMLPLLISSSKENRVVHKPKSWLALSLSYPHVCECLSSTAIPAWPHIQVHQLFNDLVYRACQSLVVAE